MANLIYVANPT